MGNAQDKAKNTAKKKLSSSGPQVKKVGSTKEISRPQSERLPQRKYSLPPGTEPAKVTERKSVKSGSVSVDSSSSEQKIRVNFDRQTSSYYDTSKKEDIVLTAAHREMIESCWANSRSSDVGTRTYLRVLEKRPDLQNLYDSIGKDAWQEEGRLFSDFLCEIVVNLNNLEEIHRMSQEFGKKHVDWRQSGFKPDFWVTVADAMTTECLYLDEGVHPPAEVIEAWGSLITLMFSSMRDGYYERLRQQRRASKRVRRQGSFRGSRTSNTSVDAEPEESEENPETPQNGRTTAVIISDFFT